MPSVTSTSAWPLESLKKIAHHNVSFVNSRVCRFLRGHFLFFFCCSLLRNIEEYWENVAGAYKSGTIRELQIFNEQFFLGSERGVLVRFIFLWDTSVVGRAPRRAHRPAIHVSTIRCLTRNRRVYRVSLLRNEGKEKHGAIQKTD